MRFIARETPRPVERGERAVKLQVQLRVRPHRELRDRSTLPRRQREARKVEVSEYRERQREDDAIGHHIVGHAREPQAYASVPTRPGRLQCVAGHERLRRQGALEPLHDHVVAPGDPEALVRARVGNHERLEQVDRRQIVGLEAEEALHERSECQTEQGTRSAGQVRLEPLCHRQLIELDCVGPGLVVEVPTDAPVVGPQPAHEGIEIGEHVRHVAQPPVEPDRIQTACRERLLDFVHEWDPEFLGERPDVVMTTVYVLPAVLGGLTGVEETTEREAPTSDPLLRLVERGRDPVAVQSVDA